MASVRRIGNPDLGATNMGLISSLQREKLDPLFITEFNSKCTITSPTTNRQLKKRPLSRKCGKNFDSLYKEISTAARNADVNLSNVVRDVRDEQKKVKQWEKIRKSNQNLRRWSFLSKLVRSGWLLGKKGRSLKAMEDRMRKRRLYERNLGTLPISYQASLRKSERTSAYASLYQQKIADDKSQPCVGTRMNGGRANSLPAINVDNRFIMSRGSNRRSSLKHL